MFTHYSVSTVLVVALIGTFVPPLEGQVEPLAAEVEARLRASFAAWSAGDIETITSGTGSATGFGFRSVAPRGAEDPAAGWSREVLSRFFGSIEYYNARLDEIHSAVHGDVVVAWGFFTEDFKHRGRDPEVYRIRFSGTWIRGQDGQLRSVLNHRDIQAFDTQGRYVPDYQ